MLTGSCFCKKVKIEYDGSSPTVALCHCTDCRKLTSSPYTLNFLFPTSSLKILGPSSPKEISKTSDTGNKIKNYFCQDCGSPIYGGTLNTNGEIETAVVRGGVFDDWKMLNEAKPVIEIYVKQRLSWIAPVEGCAQFDGMPPSS